MKGAGLATLMRVDSHEGGIMNAVSRTSTYSLTLGQGTLDVTVHVHGQDNAPATGQPGHSFLFLHGGGGPQTVTAFADLLARQRSATVFTPVHPGFDGTPRPGWLHEG